MRTRLSSKGQLVLPKPLRERHGWTEGTVIELEEIGDTVVLRAPATTSTSRIEDLLGCIPYRGRPRSLKEMDAAVRAEAARRR